MESNGTFRVPEDPGVPFVVDAKSRYSSTTTTAATAKGIYDTYSYRVATRHFDELR